MTRENFKPKPRGKVYRGQQLYIGPMRIVIGPVKDDKAEVLVVLNNETTLGNSQACPVESLEKLIDWYEKPTPSSS